MESIEATIEDYCAKWEHYCFPDKSEKCRGEVDSLLKEIDQLQESISTCYITQVKVRRRKLNYSTLRVKFLINYQPTRNLLKNFCIKVYKQCLDS